MDNTDTKHSNERDFETLTVSIQVGKTILKSEALARKWLPERLAMQAQASLDAYYAKQAGLTENEYYAHKRQQEIKAMLAEHAERDKLMPAYIEQLERETAAVKEAGV